MTTTKKWYSYPRVMTIWNNVHPSRENLIHTTSTLSALGHMPLVRFLRAIPVCANFLRWPNRVGGILLLLRKSDAYSISQPSWVACRTHPSFSPNSNHCRNRLKSSICWRTCYIGLLGPYRQHVIVVVSYVAAQADEIVNIALHQEYSLGIVFIFSQGRKYLYHV
jgi:hypothetical protein